MSANKLDPSIPDHMRSGEELIATRDDVLAPGTTRSENEAIPGLWQSIHVAIPIERGRLCSGFIAR